MKQALRLAARGRGTTSPNPVVGAVIVSKGKVVGTGYHKQAGGPHAEIHALHKAKSRARGSTLYVTLEPCCHTGKRTPPCVPRLIEAGIHRVVVAMRDPNPRVSGRGIRQLRQAGLNVEAGCLQKDAEQLNEAYVHWIKTGRPFVILKTAMTLDGKIATASGESKWITGPKAREHVHRLRRQVDAILVGINTVLKDDPQLTVRLPGKTNHPKTVRQPIRVILDSRLRTPMTARVLQSTHENSTLIFTTHQAPKKKIEQLHAKGADVIVLPQKGERVSMGACLQYLGKKGVTSLMVEGGSEINAVFLRSGLVNRLMLYIAPAILGGQDAKSWVGGNSPKHLSGKAMVSDVTIQRLGQDILIAGDVSK